jgi:hypothetical protein
VCVCVCVCVRVVIVVVVVVVSGKEMKGEGVGGERHNHTRNHLSSQGAGAMRCVFLPRMATTEFQMPPKRAQTHLHSSRGDETCSDVSAGPRKQVVFPTGGGGTHDWGLSRQPVVVCGW